MFRDVFCLLKIRYWYCTEYFLLGIRVSASQCVPDARVGVTTQHLPLGTGDPGFLRLSHISRPSLKSIRSVWRSRGEIWNTDNHPANAQMRSYPQKCVWAFTVSSADQSPPVSLTLRMTFARWEEGVEQLDLKQQTVAQDELWTCQEKQSHTEVWQLHSLNGNVAKKGATGGFPSTGNGIETHDLTVTPAPVSGWSWGWAQSSRMDARVWHNATCHVGKAMTAARSLWHHVFAPLLPVPISHHMITRLSSWE